MVPNVSTVKFAYCSIKIIKIIFIVYYIDIDTFSYHIFKKISFFIPIVYHDIHLKKIENEKKIIIFKHSDNLKVINFSKHLKLCKRSGYYSITTHLLNKLTLN